MIKRLFTKYKNIIKLGRWEHREDNKKKMIKATLANIDHCGDKICGDPKKNKKFRK